MFVNINNIKVSIYTLGCKVNQYESDSMADMLASEGAVIVPFSEPADVCIINTCSVTNIADRKSRQMIHRAKKNNKDAVIVAAGCYVQADKDSLIHDGYVDIIVGNNRKKDIVRIIDEYISAHKVSDNFIDINKTCEYESMTLVKPNEHTRAYVKVQDGCNNFCSYCIIPYTRGRIRSRSIAEVIEEIKRLAASGIKEVVLTGINLSSYDDCGMGLLDLLLAVNDVEGIERIRMGSLEPRIITEELLDVISKEHKICPHFHLSLQSACNDTLKRMNRKYTIEEYKEKCKLIRKYYDKPAITTDVIVGFPGETEEEFDITVKNLCELALYEIHVFQYSRRKGTAAASMPNQVSDGEKVRRSNTLLALTKKQKEEYEALFKGTRQLVLVEECVLENGAQYIKGHTERYILIKMKPEGADGANYINELVETVY
ncbi:MAG: tRNA (N(6)-L-threonylcarbamoyladenosine(37)-C(2))-methylthiotransferase MtaB [Clostridium sp.]|nr:tRNA (N(6)-L-threonylcarbamoyladenosine(37)-C(2))-methylthiotransferase MtaB [Clostridium sp.]MCM1172456.1 tRNA (N(6)-L-threonylcarbamoyladenosine(37)-C(2))-methylthiotransferase MtaB [Clostridium sp.]MCM1208769.1 tRNA (N(6)-L-threonylcarbamoyladenosine(37)-C(2))-methylthiotransferase MtaB [Ruminococcus sp.]